MTPRTARPSDGSIAVVDLLDSDDEAATNNTAAATTATTNGGPGIDSSPSGRRSSVKRSSPTSVSGTPSRGSHDAVRSTSAGRSGSGNDDGGDGGGGGKRRKSDRLNILDDDDDGDEKEVEMLVDVKPPILLAAMAATAAGQLKMAGEDDDSDVEDVTDRQLQQREGGGRVWRPSTRSATTAAAAAASASAFVPSGANANGNANSNRNHNANGNTDASGGNLKSDDGDDDDTQNTKPAAAAGGRKKDGDDDDDDEVAIIATSGQNALADFPHSRANCVTHPFSLAANGNGNGSNNDHKLAHCPNCYCYVCDIPASNCQEWTVHCAATHDELRWRQERDAAKRRRVQETASASSSSSSSTAVAATNRSSHSSSSSASGGGGRRKKEFSLQELLKRITVIHPVELSPPPSSGFSTTLRHYQKQSLAFMVESEHGSGLVTPFAPEYLRKMRGGILADEVGMGKSAVCLALVATNPASPKTLASEQQIREQVASINQSDRTRAESIEAFENRKKEEQESLEAEMVLEYAEENDEDRVQNEKQRRRWRLKHRHNQEWDKLTRSLRERPDPDRLQVKATVILTSVSLMGQWEDEAKKHAPGLIVKTFHSSRKKADSLRLAKGCEKIKRSPGSVNDSRKADQLDADVMVEMSEADVIISSSTFYWPRLLCNGFEFHRVVHDESHLLIKGGVSAKLDAANMIKATFRWGCTATPFTSSITDLTNQLTFLMGTSFLCINRAHMPLRVAMSNYSNRNTSQDEFDALVDALSQAVVRHSKSQRIQGEEALALPPSTTTTIMLTMSPEEDLAFNRVHTSAGFNNRLVNGTQTFTVQRIFSPPMGAILRSSKHDALTHTLTVTTGTKNKPKVSTSKRFNPAALTKVRALRQDLAEFRRSDPEVRAVVFTQFLDVHDALVRGLHEDGFRVFEFTGSTSASKRDEAIRRFQGDEDLGKPAVFVVTMRSGNVGVTLTAASRVYLMEPCIDPAVEVQAAGRIHRLGQNKPCQVIKFVFRDSYESNIMTLHEKIRNGKAEIIDGFCDPKVMRILANGIRGAPRAPAKKTKKTKKKRAPRVRNECAIM